MRRAHGAVPLGGRDERRSDGVLLVADVGGRRASLPCVVASASDSLDLSLQVGRVLRGRALAFAVLLRELPLWFIEGDASRVAPAWIVVRNRQDGRKIVRVRAGRQLGAGEEILTTMVKEAAEMDRDTFLARWHHRQ